MFLNPVRTPYNPSKILSVFEDVASEKQIVVIPEDAQIQNCDLTSSKVLILKSGVVKLYVSQDDNRIVMGYCTVGDMFNIPQSGTGKIKYFAESLTQVHAYTWELSKINELQNLFPEISSMIEALNESWILLLMNRLRSVGLQNAKERVLNWVNEYLNNKSYVQHKLWGYLTVAEMADYCGLSPKEFNFHLNNLVAKRELRLENNFPAELIANRSVTNQDSENKG